MAKASLAFRRFVDLPTLDASKSRRVDDVITSKSSRTAGWTPPQSTVHMVPPLLATCARHPDAPCPCCCCMRWEPGPARAAWCPRRIHSSTVLFRTQNAWLVVLHFSLQPCSPSKKPKEGATHPRSAFGCKVKRTRWQQTSVLVRTEVAVAAEIHVCACV